MITMITLVHSESLRIAAHEDRRTITTPEHLARCGYRYALYSESSQAPMGYTERFMDAYRAVCQHAQATGQALHVTDALTADETEALGE